MNPTWPLTQAVHYAFGQDFFQIRLPYGIPKQFDLLLTPMTPEWFSKPEVHLTRGSSNHGIF